MSLGTVHSLDLTLPTPAENLAWDEALLDQAEARNQEAPGVLRFWESTTHFVVLGYAGRVHEEADVPACERSCVPIHRRCSGGGTVLQGPGCLNYSLVLPIEESGSTATIQGTNRFVMERHALALSALLGRKVQVEGHTDLAINGLKFSGNAQRRRQRWLLFHGTFLLGLDLKRVETLLRPPPRQPEYRRKRSHGEFLMQLDTSRTELKAALSQAWNAQGEAEAPSHQAIQRLVAQKYGRREWNLKW